MRLTAPVSDVPVQYKVRHGPLIIPPESGPICRAILFTPTTWEKESLLAHDYDPLDIVLDIDPGEGPHPVLSASFWDAGTFGVSTAARIPKRMLAACAGLISDRESLSNGCQTV